MGPRSNLSSKKLPKNLVTLPLYLNKKPWREDNKTIKKNLPDEGIALVLEDPDLLDGAEVSKCLL